MSDKIVIDKSMLRHWGGIALAAVLAISIVYVVKRRLPTAGPFEVASIERADPARAVDRDVVVLKDGARIENVGFQLKSLGSIAMDKDHGALILSGVECTDCAALESLFIHSLPDGRTLQLPYPGQVYDPPVGDRTEGELSLESRVFYGECFEEIGPAIVIYRNAREAGGGFKQSVSVMSFRENGALQETSSEEAPYQVGEMLKAAEKHCKEIPGKVLRH